MRLRTLITVLITALASGFGLSARAAESPDAEDISIRFRSNKTVIESAVRPNADNLAALDAILNGPRAAKIKRIELVSSTSPNGPDAINKRLAHERAQTVMDYVNERYSSLPESVWQVTEVYDDWKPVENYFRRSKKAYRDEALQIVRGNASNKEELLQDLYAGEAWDDLINYCFPYQRTVKLHIVYEDDTAGQGGGQVTIGQQETRPSGQQGQEGGIVRYPRARKYTIYFDQAGHAIRYSMAGNEATLEDIKVLVQDLGRDSLIIEAFASPEGTLQGNYALSKRRGESVSKKLVEMGVPASKISIRAMGEDWVGLLDNAVADYDRDDRDEVLRVLGSSLSEETKKVALRKLDGGRSWQHLLKNEMPSLRRVTVYRFSPDETLTWLSDADLKIVDPNAITRPEAAESILNRKAPKRVTPSYIRN